MAVSVEEGGRGREKNALEDKLGVEQRVRSLGDRSIDLLEDCREEVHLEDDVVDRVDRNTVADVVSVLDEEEDDGREDFLGGRSDEPGEAEDEGAGAVREGQRSASISAITLDAVLDNIRKQQ